MSKKKARWRKLDNAAKLYSAASNKKDTRVFRFYCELKEEVNPDVLQEALNQTIEIFPTFLMVLRKGLFWHYLEPCNLRPIVKEEYKEPCSRLYIKDKKTLLFEVTYYKKRINFEVFHVLTDGTGATEFLKELVKNYLTERGYGDRAREFTVSSATVELAAAALGCEGARIAKSLSFKVEDKPIIIVVAGDAKVDNSRYKAQFHTKAKMLTHEEAHELIGHDVGGVCPFALPEDVKVYLDVSMKRFETVFPAAGSSNSAVEMTCDELERYASNFAAWVDVCKGWRPEEQG